MLASCRALLGLESREVREHGVWQTLAKTYSSISSPPPPDYSSQSPLQSDVVKG